MNILCKFVIFTPPSPLASMPMAAIMCVGWKIKCLIFKEIFLSPFNSSQYEMMKMTQFYWLLIWFKILQWRRFWNKKNAFNFILWSFFIFYFIFDASELWNPIEILFSSLFPFYVENFPLFNDKWEMFGFRREREWKNEREKGKSYYDGGNKISFSTTLIFRFALTLFLKEMKSTKNRIKKSWKRREP